MQDQFDALSGEGDTRAFYGAFFHAGFEVVGVEELVFRVWHVLGGRLLCSWSLALGVLAFVRERQ